MPERRQLFLRGRGREGMGGDACRRLCPRRQTAGMCRSGTTFILFHQVLSYFLVSDHHSISEVGEKHVQIISQSPNIISHMLYHNPSILLKGLNPYCFISGSNYCISRTWVQLLALTGGLSVWSFPVSSHSLGRLETLNWLICLLLLQLGGDIVVHASSQSHCHDLAGL